MHPGQSTIGQGSKTLICISFTKLNIHLLLERVFLNFPGYSLTVTQMQANATKRLHKFRNRSHFSRDTKRIYEKTYYSHASSVVSTVTQMPKKTNAEHMRRCSCYGPILATNAGRRGLSAGNTVSCSLSRGETAQWLERESADRKVRGMGNLAVSQLSCLLRVAWQLGTKRVLKLNVFNGFTSLSAYINRHSVFQPPSKAFSSFFYTFSCLDTSQTRDSAGFQFTDGYTQSIRPSSNKKKLDAATYAHGSVPEKGEQYGIPPCSWDDEWNTLEHTSPVHRKQATIQLGFNWNIRLMETRGLCLPDEPQEGQNWLWAVRVFSNVYEDILRYPEYRTN
ncbi:hypothetical protein CSKR_110765 [Clonorchis sinensis]|uniref:Uncharacterized protein n=1 Tax=Clonorchis sinensis TaxID=79923 RepID=A0A419Q1W6_CLOSI|nr:hypothetical protein CSKR_110765 [Clonorchis sinensis]